MPLSRRTISAAFALGVLVAVSAARSNARANGGFDNDRSTRPRTVVALTEAAEQARIRVHLDSAITELSQQPVAALTASQRAHRTDAISALRAYRDRGVFPHNYDFPGQAVPYFVDRKTGTLCAVAYLLASTGRRDIVDRVARMGNNARVAQPASDTALSAWLAKNGLTPQEAAFIQVVYVQTVSTAQVARNVAFGAAVPLAFAGSAMTSISNVRGNSDGQRAWVNVLGLASGAVGIGTSIRLAQELGAYPAARTVAAVNAAAGALSVGLSVRGFRRHSAIAAEREAARRSIATADLAPYVSSTAGHTTGGVAMSLRY
jgi:hypothetical protein